MPFIVQISPFVHLFTLEIVFRWGLNPPKLNAMINEITKPRIIW
jgi:hypothetical protein